MTSADGEARARTLFWVLLAVATALRMLLAAFVPLSGDEAYYWDWVYQASATRALLMLKTKKRSMNITLLSIMDSWQYKKDIF